MAFRLQRASPLGWGPALAASGALFGGIGNTIVDSFDDLHDLSPFEHTARLPMDTMNWTPLFVLTTFAAVTAP